MKLTIKDLAASLPIIPYANSSHEFFYRYITRNWRSRKKQINKQIKARGKSVPEFQALATRYMVDITTHDIPVGGSVFTSCIVEQGTAIHYVLPVWIKNIYGHVFVQKIEIFMTFDGEQLTLEYESYKDYKSSLDGRTEYYVEVIDEELV